MAFRDRFPTDDDLQPSWSGPFGLLSGAFQIPQTAGFPTLGTSATPATRIATDRMLAFDAEQTQRPASAPLGFAPPDAMRSAPQPVAAEDARASAMSASPSPSFAPPAEGGGLLSRISNGINANSNMLMAFGAGLAGGRSWGDGLSRGMAGAVEGSRLDRIEKGQTATVKALMTKGMDQVTAEMVAGNPALMSSVAGSIFKPQTRAMTADEMASRNLPAGPWFVGSDGRPFLPEGLAQLMSARQQEARNAADDRYRSADLDLKRRAADRADDDKFTPVKGEDATGTSVYGSFNPRTGVTTMAQPSGTAQPSNPFGAGGKFNEGQGKAAGFADRMLQSEGVLGGIGGKGGVLQEGASALQSALSGNGPLNNYVISEGRQKYEQARRDFINAQLRRESGAAISPSEFENAERQYFPIPGDSAAVIKQKTANRRAAVEAMGREGGPSYSPRLGYDDNGFVNMRKGFREGGYEFRGGDPADAKSWARIGQ